MNQLPDLLRAEWRRTVAVVAALAGAVALLVGWLRASDALYTGEQVPYLISGGLGGLFLLGVAAVAWISADLRAEAGEVEELAAEVARLAAASGDAGAGADGGRARGGADG